MLHTQLIMQYIQAVSFLFINYVPYYKRLRTFNWLLVVVIFFLIPLASIIHLFIHFNLIFLSDEQCLIRAWLFTYPLVGVMNILAFHKIIRRLVHDVKKHLEENDVHEDWPSHIKQVREQYRIERRKSAALKCHEKIAIFSPESTFGDKPVYERAVFDKVAIFRILTEFERKNERKHKDAAISLENKRIRGSAPEEWVSNLSQGENSDLSFLNYGYRILKAYQDREAPVINDPINFNGKEWTFAGKHEYLEAELPDIIDRGGEEFDDAEELSNLLCEMAVFDAKNNSATMVITKTTFALVVAIAEHTASNPPDLNLYKEQVARK